MDNQTNMSIENRVFSGMGPTGRLHIGHYHGALKNWCHLQHQHTCFFMIADMAALTTLYDSIDVIQNSIWEMLVDWLAAGVDPEKATIFIQSRVPAQVELAWLLGMSTPIPWLQEIPAYKEKLAKLQGKNLQTLGFLADPVMQAADILAYKATQIPVGADQVEHLRVAGEIAHRFNALYGQRHPQGPHDILPQPQPLLTEQSQLPGLDGEKMSKSYGNAIFLRSSASLIAEKVQGMAVARDNVHVPGNPNACPVFKFHRVYSPRTTCDSVEHACRSGRLNCGDCKQPLVQSITEEQNPMRERAEPFLAKPSLLKDIVDAGCDKARAIAETTLVEVREIMGLSYRMPLELPEAL
ncbi:tryptophan--tRNA ligase [Chitinivorax sp. B]|uniref:tryptophan--tRNA ligase n=1 Tax=Chitinivorax sp. B TaxID=2502235 RepID=UPI002016A8F0|nr:tryptophan--tRNA ligase [Chitinivorax sp. B]